MIGASFTMSFVIPVRVIIFLGIGIPGLIRLVNSSENTPLTNRHADISVIRSTSGFKPVVSKSKEINEAFAKFLKRSANCFPLEMR